MLCVTDYIICSLVSYHSFYFGDLQKYAYDNAALTYNIPHPTKSPPAYRGAEKSLARPGRKQARKHVRDARDFNKLETRADIKFLFL